MDAILIEPRNENELNILKKILSKLGLPLHLVSEKDRKMFAGAKAVEIAKNHPRYNLSDDEIISMVKEVEEEVYGKK